jgi:NNP family nitrate/nitrite transporter-like MFS transporter
MLVTLVPLLGGWLWATSLPTLYALGLLLGVAGASFAAALPLASRWYPAEFQGLAMGIAGAGNSGTLFAAFFAPRLAERLGWHAVFGWAMVPLAAVLLLFALVVKEPPRPDRRGQTSEFWPVLRDPDTRFFALFYAVTFGGFVGLASFLPIWLRDQYSVSKVHAGDLTTICVLAGSFLRPVGGWLADRLGGIRMLTCLYSAVALLVSLLALLPPLPLAMVLLVSIMGCLGMGNGSVFQLVPHRFQDRVGVATGILGAAGGLGGFFLPTVFGTLKQATGSYAPGLIVFAGASMGALVCLGWAQKAWVGVWIARHGRVAAPLPAALPAGTVEPA